LLGREVETVGGKCVGETKKKKKKKKKKRTHNAHRGGRI